MGKNDRVAAIVVLLIISSVVGGLIYVDIKSRKPTIAQVQQEQKCGEGGHNYRNDIIRGVIYCRRCGATKPLKETKLQPKERKFLHEVLLPAIF